jgi:lysine 6-dehydrogenase
MDATVLGGGGLTGRCTVRDLARTGVFQTIRVADLDLTLAESAAKHAGPAATAQRVDVRDPASLAQVLDGASVCVNAVQYGFNLEVMAGCLAAGVPYLDFGGLFHMTRKQLAWDERFRAAGLLAIPGLGQVPGVSNVLAAQAAEDFDQVESIIIRDGWRDLTPNAPEVLFTWSPSTFLDEMILPAQVFQDGGYKEYPPMSSPEEFDFPAPVGRTRVYRTLHSEPATLPASLKGKGVRHCEWKEGGPGIDLLRNLALLGLGDEAPLDVRGTAVVPRAFLLALLRAKGLLGVPPGLQVDDWEIVDVELRGSKDSKPETRHAQARFHAKSEWGVTATEYAVGVAGAIGAEMIARREIRGAGVLPPERSVPPALFRRYLKERGIDSTITPPEPPLPAVAG